ncbi:50S ribosomal protein L4 [Patescibacteria group bacterium]|nr:50S ribosomal protein L4 [Patescibacteria group bacterium]MBU1673645.1 50S ribosomal protein L4 [Patescibacteria group bacterium]MBU1963867.1 50S ribosomal protein L4 [Patescibacteria group bacterium]
MAKVKIYNLEGKEVGDVTLDDKIFGIKVNEKVVHQAVVTQEANARVRLAQAKTRSEVRGGGAKPWRQKGTGRARVGSNRSPLWVGGGVTFGPNAERNFSKKINKKVKNKALRMVLSDKAVSGRIIIMENMDLPEIKTKQLSVVLNKLPAKGKTVLLSTGKKNNNLIKASANLPKVYMAAANSLNVRDLLRSEYFVIDQAGLEEIVKTYKK